MMAWVVVYSFGLLTASLLFYSGYQLYLSLVCSQLQKARSLEYPRNVSSADSQAFTSVVTFQIALFNEGHVVDALFSSLLHINYPKSLIEIQLLDDSTDASVSINSNWVKRLKAHGFEAVHLNRRHREGFKAGALNEGLKKAKGDYIAIFDADFSISPDWLVQCLREFDRHSIAAVQSRWTYGNPNQNLTTKIQTLALNHHFINEHIARDQLNLWTTFNGTAALWKKSAISDIGGFNTQTLTEDLNLAYRAQMAGYSIRYAANVTAESELPNTLSAYFTQQFRWNKGAAENFRLLRKSLSLSKKGRIRFHGFMHLLGSTFYLASFLWLLLGLSTLIVPFSTAQQYAIGIIASSVSLSALLLGIALYRAERLTERPTPFVLWAIYLLIYLTLSAGMSFMNTRAVIEGHLGIRSPFVRTPKLKQFKGRLKLSFRYLRFVEGFIAIFAWAAVAQDFQSASFSLLGIHLFTAIAFSWVWLSSWRQV